MIPVINKWSKYGYASSPYSTDQIPARDGSEKLLVGRTDELENILENLMSGTQLIALEGDFGVGKSSLAAVAAFQASTWIGSGGPFFLTAVDDRPLELAGNDTADSFEKRVYYRIAASILRIADQLQSDGYHLTGLKEFRAWLSSPGAVAWSVGIGASIAGSGGNLNFGREKQVNDSVGFNDAGVVELIDSWLAELFRSGGGVICVLDNLEVLGNYETAVDVFESLRDRLFKRKHLAWLVCGAQGMVRVAFSSGKMSGVFQEPIDIYPLEAKNVPDVISARAEMLRVGTASVLPVSPHAFELLYLKVGKNLRFALMQAQSYSMRAQPDELLSMSDEERDAAVEDYMGEEARKVVEQLPSKLSAADWKVLIKLVRDKSGLCSPSEYADFGYTDMPPLLVRVGKLVAAGVATYSKDEEDGRRRLISATNNGRLAVLSQAS